MILNCVKYTDTEEELIKRVRNYDWRKLEKLWTSIKNGAALNWSKGKALEYMLIRAFDLSGAEVVYPYNNTVNNAQEQFDGFVYVKELAVGFLVECKDWKSPVAFDELAKLQTRLTYRLSSTYGMFLSKSGYTSSAIEMMCFMHPHNILLWSSEDIDECFKKRKFLDALIYKYKYAMATADLLIAVLDGINI